ncbi:MAG: TraR/DksA C4-type zinc finger protein [Deltaproteobacteria bacterium]|nr:TraR/DksA C4-type zinc finger protein [Deltaproteobacteria bacterium]MBI5809992.1 TraR/DksA C4-type zinc finger protein [Deltaproteobacteria bacterium]
MADEKALRLKMLKKMLIEKKRKMWSDLRDDIFRKLGKEYNAQFDNPHDIEEMAFLDVIEETGIAVADIRRKELEDMDSALRKLDDGTYGVCGVCGEDIDGERLKAVPFATHCVRCKTKDEGRI